MKAASLLSIVFVLHSAIAFADDSPQPVLVDVRRIWDKAPHNAFTDLSRFKDRWYCVLREGKSHGSPDGAFRVITSADGEAQMSVCVLSGVRFQLAVVGPLAHHFFVISLSVRNGS